MSFHFARLSNRIELLLEDLKRSLYEQSSPFASRLLVVPSPFMKSWLMWQIARDPRLGIATGIKICYLNEAIAFLAEKLKNPLINPIPTVNEIALGLEVEMLKMIQSYGEMRFEEQRIWKPLLDYLKIHPDHSEFTLSEKNAHRLAVICDQVARLFQQYGVYGGRMVDSWSKEHGWQQALWIKLFEENKWPSVYRSLKKLISQNIKLSVSNLQIDIFGINFLSSIHHQFLTFIGTQCPVSYYFLSPCQEFWIDMRSNREMAYQRSEWHKKNLEENSYLEDHHPLLANWGKLGRQMSLQIEDTDFLVEAKYSLSKKVIKLLDYESLVSDEVLLVEGNDTPTLLEGIQSDLVLMRKSDGKFKIEIKDKKSSIQVHVAPSKMREVQIIYDVLVGMITENKNFSICPNDILVMAPDIMDYQAYIQAVFGAEASVLDYQLFDLKKQTQHSLFQGFLHLINLSEGRWDAPSIIQLMEYSEVQRKHLFLKEDFFLFRKWIEETGIKWGWDLEQRNEILQREGCLQGLADENPAGTWEYGLESLLLGLSMKWHGDFEKSQNFFPTISVEGSQGILLGKWIFFLKTLRQNLLPLTKGERLSLKDWAAYLEYLFESYFEVDISEKGIAEDLKSQIQHISSYSQYLGEAKFAWKTIKKILEENLTQQTVSYRENHLQAIKFCSMLPMRAIPAQVIVLMGMEEGKFPKSSVSHSLDLMKGSRLGDYCPSSMDYDRYLFLESLISARQYFVMSYVGKSDGKHQEASLLVEELLAYADFSFIVNGKSPSSVCTTYHPFDPFDFRYFDQNSSFRSYSHLFYRQAQIAFCQKKEPQYTFLSDLSNHSSYRLKIPNGKMEKRNLDLKDIESFARDPIKAYFHKRLELYLGREQTHLISGEEDFTLEDLENYFLKKQSFFHPVTHVLTYAEKRSKLPHGMFKSLIQNKLEEEVEQVHQFLKMIDVSSKDLFTIELKENCTKPERLAKGTWVIPALEIFPSDAPCFTLVGKLENITKEGLLVLSQHTNGGLIKVWPLCLIFDQIISSYDCFGNIKRQVCFLNSSKVKSLSSLASEKALKDYFYYYFLCLENISLWIPEAVVEVLKRENGDSLGKILKKISSHDYLKWGFGDYETIPLNDRFLVEWKDHIHRAYAEVGQWATQD